MSLYGYARVSTTDQDLGLQEAALRAGRLRGDPLGRRLPAPPVTAAPELATLLDFIRKGDTLVVTRVDRLARSVADLQDVVRALKTKGAALRATEQPIDTSTAAGKAFLDMLGVFAEFETNLRRERQMEGIAAAKAPAASTPGRAARRPWTSQRCAGSSPKRSSDPWRSPSG